MKKNYMNPEVSVMQFAGTSLMQAASGSQGGGGDSGNSGVYSNITTDDQW